MSNCNNIDKILKRSGTNQLERYIDDLNPENLQLHDFSIEDWIIFAYNFAKHINFFDTDSNTASNNWQVFFASFGLSGKIPFRTSYEYQKIKNNITSILTQYKEEGKLTPHLTLFVSFLQLLEWSKKRFNKLTKRHLNFYYKKILQVDKLDFTADKVHVIFELAKRSVITQIAEKTAVDAKKDTEGKQLIYETNEELIANKASVASLKSVYNDIALKEFKSSAVAKTLDGLEEPLPKEKPYWYPFAYTSNEENFIELPNATIGFAIASPLFNLKEGLRIIEITINFEEKTGLEKFDITKLIEHIQIHGSGEKEWVTPIKLLPEIQNNLDADKPYTTSVKEKQIKFAFQLEKDAGALVNYNPEILVEKYQTTFPLLRFLIDTSKKKEQAVGHDIYQALISKAITNITIKIDVQAIKSVIIENDFGILKAKKPFYPFTTQPIKNSNFKITNEEVFSKNWKNLKVNLKWKNTPKNFKNWYNAYAGTQNKESFTMRNELLYKNEWIEVEDKQLLFSEIKTEEEMQLQFKNRKNKSPVNFKIRSVNQFVQKKDNTYLDKIHLDKIHLDKIHLDNIHLDNIHLGFESNITFTNKNIYEIGKVTSLRLSLNQSFLHKKYPNLYALAIISEANVDIKKVSIPNEPYTPLVEEISIAYTAEESINIGGNKTQFDFKTNRIQLFHEHPFGQSEEHKYLKTTKAAKGITTKGDDNENIFLVPNYEQGAFFIGLENAEVLQNVALLIQVLEGSENPLVSPFKKEETIDWSILCANKWKSLKETILTNSTANFLKSGIIKFTIPREATNKNSVLPEGYIWVRARMKKAYNAVCKVIDVHAQAVEATFKNNDNELSHLENGLPNETISKLITRTPQIKGVEQPYNSFNGVLQESDTAFYRRISERLRHKNRAISLWDYEHLILQKFPEIYKVKCLNHTKENNFIAAGHVTLVVIPDTVNKNVFDIYQPRVSKVLLNKVTCFINQLNTMHVNAEVINPKYEEIEITLEVKFHIGYDENFYQKQLEKDIIKFLSPWAFDESKTVVFGMELHQSTLINHLEKLVYVDYLQNIEIRKENILSANSVSPSNPKAILVSAKKHHINLATIICETFKEQEACQE
ncbi:MAG: baseplate J/gp47 family protein [Flavobacteriaceae bacterium]|nr:baseplate J/gp47 family protein [Flavobacteriaceae bacterium]